MTFAKTSLLALAATLVTVPAFADPASLARSVGVEPGVYSVAQLIELKSLDDGEQARRNFILDNPAGAGDAMSSKSVTDRVGASAKFAASAGVEPGLYSVDQLIELNSLNDGEQARRNFILDNPEGAGDTVASRSAVEGAGLEGKLAGSVGVEPGLYSVEQLIQLKALDDGDNARRAHILENPAFGS